MSTFSKLLTHAGLVPLRKSTESLLDWNTHQSLWLSDNRYVEQKHLQNRQKVHWGLAPCKLGKAAHLRGGGWITLTFTNIYTKSSLGDTLIVFSQATRSVKTRVHSQRLHLHADKHPDVWPVNIHHCARLHMTTCTHTNTHMRGKRTDWEYQFLSSCKQREQRNKESLQLPNSLYWSATNTTAAYFRVSFFFFFLTAGCLTTTVESILLMRPKQPLVWQLHELWWALLEAINSKVKNYSNTGTGILPRGSMYWKWKGELELYK